MRWICYAVCLSVVAVHLSNSMPTSQESLSSTLVKEEFQTINSELQYPTLEARTRQKRTIGVFRRIFPELSKMLDDKIQQITRVIFRIVGRAVLSGGLGGGNAGGGGSTEDSTRRISIVLPTYPPDEDEEESTDDSPPSATEESSTADSSNGNNVIPESDDSNSVGEAKKRSLDKDENQKSIGCAGLGERLGVAIWKRKCTGVTRHKAQGEREVVEGNVQSEASEKKEVRVPFVPSQSENDLQTAASGEDNVGAESSQEEFSDDIDISETEENSRSKRLGVFGNLFGGASAGASAGGGSGNFLFDIIRRTADGAARAAGTVYRLVAGTDDFGLQGYANEPSVPSMALTMAAQTPVTASVPPPPTSAASASANTTLVAGSGATEQQDENANSPLVPTDQIQPQPIDDGYQTGIPGPITRLFVIANRGIANLVQDLILRLAQTSERIVNFKARLITAII